MPIAERLPGTLQENLLTLLAHSDEHGRAVASLVDPALFEGDYRMIAERAVEYWHRYGRAPGPHLPDLFSDILESKHDRRGTTLRAVFLDMLRLSEAINPKYAIDSARSFVRMQRFQAGVLDAARKLQAQRELALPEVEEMFGALLRARDDTMDHGVTLNDTDKLVEFLRNTAVEFKLGIPELDRRNVGPMRGAVMLWMAGTGIGKTWALVHCSRQALMQRKKVFYASLEESEGSLLQKFYQSFFGVADRRSSDPLLVRAFEKDSFGRLSAIEAEEVTPEFCFDSDNLEDELATRRALFEGKFKNIVIKRFPTRGLTIGMLRAYLDSLEASGFIPDVIVLDYVGIMKIESRGDDKEHVGLGRVFDEFRGLCIERDAAGITAQQINRPGARAKQSSQYDVAGAFSLAATADVSITISATSAEKQFGLARLFLEKARRARDRFGILLSQSYDTGQFIIDSVPLDARYDRLFDGGEGGAEDGAAGEDE